MARAILIIDELADYYRSKLGSAFPSLEIRAVAKREDAGDLLIDVEAICGMGEAHVFNDELIRRAARLKWIQIFTSGTDHILLLPSLRREVVVTSLRGIHGPAVSEMAFLHMLALSRDFPRMLRNQENGIWERIPQKRLFGKTVTILGVGAIGADLATRCEAFGMTVIGVTNTPRSLPGFARMVRRADLEQAAGEADFLVVLVANSKDTRNIVSARVLAAMKPSAYVINLARGGVLDEDALLAALRDKRIAGAGLDVFRTEPLPPEHPLWRAEKVLCTPHQSGRSDVYHEQVLSVLEANVRYFLEDRYSDMTNLVPH